MLGCSFLPVVFFCRRLKLKLKQKTCQKQGSQQIFGPSCFVTTLIPKIALKYFSINADRFGKITICHHLKSIFYVNSHLNLSDFSELRMSKKYFNAIFAIVLASFLFPFRPDEKFTSVTFIVKNAMFPSNLF